MDLKEVIHGLLEEIRKISDSETVVGKPITMGDATIIPVSKLSIGFGTGTMQGRGASGGARAEGNFEGGGAGGGIQVSPQAFVVVDKTGAAQLLSLTDSKVSVLGRALDLVPQVIERVLPEGRSSGAQLGSGKAAEHGASHHEGAKKK